MSNNDFAVFILTHGRPDRVITYKTLKRQGYTGPVYIIIDNEDITADKYIQNFGKENVLIFDKKEIAKTFDEMDNFSDRRAIIYARNYCFEAAKKLGYKYFLQLDDDYHQFIFRINDKGEHPKDFYVIKNTLGKVFEYLLNYYKKINNVTSIATSQGGDWFGGEREFGKAPKRKAMNTFFCSTERPFTFVGRLNEDVNTYTYVQSQGKVFFTIPFIQMNQLQTQTNKGGMTDIYLNSGTYIKSFYTIICAPSCTKINLMGRSNRRLHHCISWENTVPQILQEKYKKYV